MGRSSRWDPSHFAGDVQQLRLAEVGNDRAGDGRRRVAPGDDGVSFAGGDEELLAAKGHALPHERLEPCAPGHEERQTVPVPLITHLGHHAVQEIPQAGAEELKAIAAQVWGLDREIQAALKPLPDAAGVMGLQIVGAFDRR